MKRKHPYFLGKLGEQGEVMLGEESRVREENCTIWKNKYSAGEGRGLWARAEVCERGQWLTKDCRQFAHRSGCGSKE